jgi:DNA-binding NarL/FixJ family response regulator
MSRIVSDAGIATAMHHLRAVRPDERNPRPAPPEPMRADPPHGGPPTHLAPVVRTLMAGMTDDRAADALGMSPRTYSRRVSELALLLGVQSRFQAGVEAVRRGWLDPLRPATREATTSRRVV